MRADVVKGADSPVVAPHDQRALTDDVQRNEVAGFREITPMTHELPVLSEQLLFLDLEQLVVEIRPGGQSPPIPLGGRRPWVSRNGHVDIRLN